MSRNSVHLMLGLMVERPIEKTRRRQDKDETKTNEGRTTIRINYVSNIIPPIVIPMSGPLPIVVGAEEPPIAMYAPW